MNIGVLTGGGDCPGLNAIIRAVTRKAISCKHQVIGIKSGWEGLIKPNTMKLGLDDVSGILSKGGTILKTSRTNPCKDERDMKKVMKNLKKRKIDALIAIGGDDTLSVALELYKRGVKVVGVPKTIDNDITGTDFTTGFDTSINIVMEAIDRLHTTAESHHRTMIIEVMGRHAGWIATMGGIAGGADCIVIPEEPFNIEDICELLKKRHNRDRDFSIVVVAEGAKPIEKDSFILQSKEKDAFGHVRLGGIGHLIAHEIEKRTGYETRVTVLGHIQRGGSPMAYDRILGTRMGIKAVELVNDKMFGQMTAIQRNKIVSVDLEKAVGTSNTVDKKLYEAAELFFG